MNLKEYNDDNTNRTTQLHYCDLCSKKLVKGLQSIIPNQNQRIE